MRTNIVIGDSVIEEAFALSNVRTKRELVDPAFRELVARHKSKNVMDLYGSDGMNPEYDYKAARSRDS